jgi:hypothetical protein
MIWHDLPGDSGSFSSNGGGSGTAAARVYRLQGYAAAPDGRRFDWEVETEDGRTARFWLAGMPYDLSEGSLFVVRADDTGAQVTQLSRDLSGVKPNASSCEVFARGDLDPARLIGIPTTPTPLAPTLVPDPTATLPVAVPTIAPRDTLPPPTTTPTPPPPTPTATPQPAAATSVPAPVVDRILFAPGATQATLEGYLPAMGSKVYVMGAMEGQFVEMDASVGAMGQGLRFSIVGADGVVVRAMGHAHVRTVCPSTQDYTIELVSDVGATSYRMSVLIPVRIRFEPGAISTVVTGTLAPHGTRDYVLSALADQRMVVTPHAAQGRVGLVISGADGQVLLSGRVGAPGGGYDGILPVTQDYLLTVRAADGVGAEYGLEITIPSL